MIPILDIEPLNLPALGELHDDLWSVLCDLADKHNADWTVIGGQMVMFHGLQAERSSGRVGQDLDLVIDARVRPPAIPAFIATLGELGFTSTGVSPDDVAHRFGRGPVRIDVVSPDGLGERADLRTVGTPRPRSKYAATPKHSGEPSVCRFGTEIERRWSRARTYLEQSSSSQPPSLPTITRSDISETERFSAPSSPTRSRCARTSVPPIGAVFAPRRRSTTRPVVD